MLKPHSHIHDLSHDLADVVHTTKIYVLSTILCKFCLFFEVEDSYSITIGYPKDSYKFDDDRRRLIHDRYWTVIGPEYVSSRSNPHLV